MNIFKEIKGVCVCVCVLTCLQLRDCSYCYMVVRAEREFEE